MSNSNLHGVDPDAEATSVIRFVVTDEALARWQEQKSAYVNGKVITSSQEGVKSGDFVTARKGGMERVFELAGHAPGFLFVTCVLLENTNEYTASDQPWFANQVRDLAPEPERTLSTLDKVVDKLAPISDEDKIAVSGVMLAEKIVPGTARWNSELKSRCDNLVAPKRARIVMLVDEWHFDHVREIESFVRASLAAEPITALEHEKPVEKLVVVPPLHNGNHVGDHVSPDVLARLNGVKAGPDFGGEETVPVCAGSKPSRRTRNSRSGI